MCGIAGFYNANANYHKEENYWKNILEEMRSSLVHRGSDGKGIYLKNEVGLSHARLSIRDIEGGAQPMTRISGGFSYTIVYNGEIYNTEELRSELIIRGCRFETTCDTEVILYSYIYFGEKFVEKLNGIFAFAIWDDAKKQLMLARDPAGVKPLFYSYNDGKLVFGSEPKALFCHPDITPSIDYESLQEILGVGPARTAGHGIFCGVKEVKPGHYHILGKEGEREEIYWELRSYEHTESYADTVEKVRFLVEDAVKRQMVSDVPVCAFLSGGIDSSIVTAIAARCLNEQGETLNTFSFDFAENDIYFKSNKFQPERDLPYVKRMLKVCDTNHSFLECNEKQLFDSLFNAVDVKDLPGMADVDASLLFFCSLVALKNKVCLTGECADEIFGGYPWFYRKELLQKDGFPWSSDVTPRLAFLSDEAIHDLDLAEYSYSRYLESKAKAPLLPGETGEDKSRRIIGYLNIKWFMQTLLDRMDRCSMYSGLEARVPFADKRIIEYVYNVPWHMKFQNGVEKTLLRDACKDLLPKELINRKKSPYPKTYHPGYEKLLINEMKNILHDKNAPIQPLIDASKAKEFLKAPAEYGKPWFGQLMAGPQLIAYFIQINYWMKKYHLTV
jgi:asparagine synthase (glutamine-hydrolysing)